MQMVDQIPLSVNVVTIRKGAVRRPSATSADIQQQQQQPEDPSASSDGSVRAVLGYRNPQGKQAILDASRKVHHDFSELNGTLAISILPEDLEELKRNEGVEWFEGDGKVIYCTIR